jgi:aspartate kinase
LKHAELDQSFYSSLAVAIADEVLKCGGKVPVVTGYFGFVPGSLLSAIGRGYTDLCAALLAVGLGAEELQIWKEVDGIFTADPRKVPTARLLSSITPEEAAELTFFGSEVLFLDVVRINDRLFIHLFVNRLFVREFPFV